jgi:RimJ/RimL family protein N-acetyltransferase
MLRFRRVREGDVAAVHRLHADPATNVYNPYGASATMEASRCLLREWLDHWFRYGFGYELAFAGDRLAGIGGARWDDWDGSAVQNLYWRLLPEFQGRGLSAVIAAHGREMASRQPGRPLVIARMLPSNIASIHVARKVGLRRRADLDAEFDGVEWVVYADRPALRRRRREDEFMTSAPIFN